MKLLALCAAALLCSCANGVVMTDAETKACRDVGCAALTEAELLRFMGKAFKDGYETGWKDFARQSGRSI
jgi:hypothetical protein